MSKLMFAFVATLSLATLGCKKKGGGAAGEAVAAMEGFQKSMCECKDKACADKVNADMTKWGTEMAKNAGAAKADDKPDPELAKKSADIMTKYTECMTKLMMAAVPGPGSDAKKDEPAMAGSDAKKDEPAAGSDAKKDEPAAAAAGSDAKKDEPKKEEPKKPDDKKAGGW